MFLMIGITDGQKELDHSQTVICGCCGRYGRYRVIMTYTSLLLFFIPVFRWNRQYVVEMSCCGSIYSLDPEVGRRIERGEAVEIREEDLTLVSSGQGSRGTAAAGGQGSGTAISTVRKHCSNCGYETGEDFEYCPHCGQKF